MLQLFQLVGHVRVVGRIGGQGTVWSAEGVGTQRDPELGHRHAYAGRGEEQGDLQVVLEVLADIGRVELTPDSGGLELVTRADAREHEDVRRADGTGTQHDLLLGADRAGRSVGGAVLDAACLQRAGVVQEHSGHLGAGDHREVGSLRDRTFEEGVVGARPLPLPGGGLQERHDTFGPAAVTAVVVADRNPGRDGRVDELLCAGDHRRAHRDAQWPRRAVGVGVDHDVAARQRGPRSS